MEFNAINRVILVEEICHFPIALLIIILVIYITGFLVTKNIGTKKETSWLDIIKLISLLFIMGSTLYEENPIKVHPNIIYSTFCGSRMFLFSVSPLSRNL